MLIEFVLILIIFIYLRNDKSLVKNFNQTKVYFYIILWGTIIKSLFNHNYEKDILYLYEKFTRKYKSPNKWGIGIHHVYVDKPEDIQIVLTTVLQRPHEYSFAHNESGLVTANGSLWKTQRKLLNSSFNLRVLQSFFPIFNEKVDTLLSKICNENETFNIAPYFNRFSLDSVCATSFGWDSQVQHGKHKNYLEATTAIPEIIYKRALFPWLHHDFIYKRTKLYTEEQKHFNNVYRLSKEVIANKRLELAKELDDCKTSNQDEIISNCCDEEGSNIVYNKPQILIKQLFKLCDKGDITEKILFEHCDTMIGTATETTSSAISNNILLLAMHPEIQERVYQELRNVFPEQESNVSYDDIMQLTYLDMVIKETLRVISTIPMIPRRTTVDTRLTNNYIIKKDTSVLVLITNVHRNPDIWGQNPDKFDPDHFLPENVATRHPYSYIPFGGIPRNCIGQRYSMFSMKIVLSKILRMYRFTTEQKYENIKQVYGITTTLIGKHYVKLHKREYV